MKEQGLQAIFPITSSDHETLTPERLLKALVSYLIIFLFVPRLSRKSFPPRETCLLTQEPFQKGNTDSETIQWTIQLPRDQLEPTADVT